MSMLLVIQDDMEARLISYILAESDLEHHCAVATTVRDAESQLRAQPWSVVILDDILPDGSGFDVLQTLRSRGFEGGIIVLSSSSHVMDKIRALEAGADDYISRPYEPGEVIARLRTMLRRSWHRSGAGDDGIVRAGSLELDLHTMKVMLPDNRQEQLTPNEMRLLHYLMTHSERVVEQKELLAHIFGPGGQKVPSNAIGVYVCRMRQKLEPQPDQPRYIVTVRGRGYRLVCDN
jgi:two-component system, OmpR family, KDP operon response regulator KdpE